MIFKNNTTSMVRLSRVFFLIIIMLFVSFSIIYGQKTKEDQFPYDQKATEGIPPIQERFFFGGSFGLMFGTITDIQVSPVVGFWVLPRIAVAAGPTFRYYKDPLGATTIYGGRTYVQLVAIQDLSSVLPLGVHTGVFLHIEDELLSLKANFWKYPLNPKGRFFLNTVLVGPGISQQLGKRASLNFMVLWPLNDSSYDIYSNPEVRIAFTF